MQGHAEKRKNLPSKPSATVTVQPVNQFFPTFDNSDLHVDITNILAVVYTKMIVHMS